MQIFFLAILTLTSLVFEVISFLLPPLILFESTITKSIPLTPDESLVPLQIPTEVVFVGDILLARDVETKQHRFGHHYPFRRITFKSNQYIVGNFESSIPPVHQHTPDLHMQFSSATSSGTVLRTAGFTHVSLANNHTLDYGAASFDHTKEVLQAAGIDSFGHPNVLNDNSYSIVSTLHGNLALIGLQAIDILPNLVELEQLLARVSAKSDWQVVYIHWGPEYQLSASQLQTTFARKLVAFGADLIIGHHPHVVQNIDLIDGVPVFYSLGNFVFDQYFSLAVQEGLTIVLDISAQQIRLEPVTSIDSRTQPRYLTSDEKQIFLEQLAAVSAVQLDTQIRSGVLKLDWQVASSAKIATIHK